MDAALVPVLDELPMVSEGSEEDGRHVLDAKSHVTSTGVLIGVIGVTGTVGSVGSGSLPNTTQSSVPSPHTCPIPRVSPLIARKFGAEWRTAGKFMSIRPPLSAGTESRCLSP